MGGMNWGSPFWSPLPPFGAIVDPTDPILVPFGASLTLFQSYLAPILGPFWITLGHILGHLGSHFGDILESFWGTLWGHLGTDRGALLGHFGGHFGAILGPFWGHFAERGGGNKDGGSR